MSWLGLKLIERLAQRQGFRKQVQSVLERAAGVLEVALRLVTARQGGIVRINVRIKRDTAVEDANGAGEIPFLAQQPGQQLVILRLRRTQLYSALLIVNGVPSPFSDVPFQHDPGQHTEHFGAVSGMGRHLAQQLEGAGSD